MITNPQAIAFANQRIRPSADRLAQAYYALKSLVNDWNSQNVAAVLAPGDATIIGDGSVTDGRHPISADDAYSIVLRAQEVVDSLEASSSAKLVAVLKVAVNSVR